MSLRRLYNSQTLKEVQCLKKKKFMDLVVIAFKLEDTCVEG